jgi:hypothetical protein
LAKRSWIIAVSCLACLAGFASGWMTLSGGKSATRGLTADEASRLLECAVGVLTQGSEAACRDPSVVGLTGHAAFVTIRSPQGREPCCRWEFDRTLASAVARAARRVRESPECAAWLPEGSQAAQVELNTVIRWQALPDTTATTFSKMVSPGLHGVFSEHDGRWTAFKDSVAITHGWSVQDLRERLRQKAELRESDFSRAKVYRYEGEHWVRFPGWSVVRMSLAHPVVDPSDVMPVSLRERARRAAEWLRRHQEPSGRFHYQYDPIASRYDEQDNEVRQMGTLSAMARARAEWAVPELDEAAFRAFRRAVGRLVTKEGLTYLPSSEGGELGASAFLLMAALELAPEPEAEKIGRRLAASIVARQATSGLIFSYFDHDDVSRGQDYYPGEALLAVARALRRWPDARQERFLRDGIDYYFARWEQDSTQEPSWWLAQAMAAYHEVQADPRLAARVFRLTDAIWADQVLTVDPGTHAWDGAYAAERDGFTFASATMTEALAAALSLAIRVDDKARIERYRSRMVRALRFVCQLQADPRNTYYLRDPGLALGGVRESLTRPQMRADYAQHFLLATLEGSRLLGRLEAKR